MNDSEKFTLNYYKVINMQKIDASVLTINNRNYFQKGKIGQGGAGVVYLVRDQSERSYALKIVRFDRRNPLAKNMLEAEINIQKKFTGNKYVIQLLSVKQENNQVSIVLELGEYSLRNYIQFRHMQQKQLLCMICDVSHGLSAIHNQVIIHRDIKPENIIFKDGTFKITDFGVAVAQQQDDSMIGTVPYWAPEIIMGKQDNFTNKIDVWSLGVTAFESFFRIHPFCPNKELDEKQYVKQLKQNIKILTPDFTMQKFINLLAHKNLHKQKKYVQNKLELVRNKQIINNLCSLFEPDPEKRFQTDYLLAIFESLLQSFEEIKVRTTKFSDKFPYSEVPEDIKMFCRAKNLFYQMNAHSKSTSYDDTLFGLQIAIWYLQGANYGGTHYVLLDKINKIKQYHKHKEQLWKEVYEKLSAYYYQIKFSNESEENIQFFDKTNELRMHIIVCSVWMRIIRESQKFCSKVSEITSLEILKQFEIFEFLPLLSEKKIDLVEKMIIESYY